MRRFPVSLEPSLVPLFAIFDGMPRRSYVHVGPGELFIGLGWGFTATIRREEFESVARHAGRSCWAGWVG